MQCSTEAKVITLDLLHLPSIYLSPLSLTIELLWNFHCSLSPDVFKPLFC